MRPSPVPPKEEKKKEHGPLSVVAVQSIACGILLLLALMLRLVGGAPYEQLRQAFQSRLMSNDLLGTLAILWDGDPAEWESDSSDLPAEDVSSAGRLPPAGTSAVGLRVNRLAAPPVPTGRVSSAYGYRTDPINGGEGFHRGVDIAAPQGTPIAAMYDGRIKAVGESESLGRYVCLSHGDGLEVMYAHCDSVTAAAGAVVRAGETVALVGSTGRSTGNHVHVQISADGTVYNPAGTVPLGRYA